MFAKDKIQIDLAMEKTDYNPGETLYGTLSVSVADTIECSGIRVKVRGVGEITVQVEEQRNNQTDTVTYTETVYDVTHYITCLGFTKVSERKGGCFLSPGATYSYNFQYQIPLDAFGSLDSGTSSPRLCVRWIVTGYVDIPNGFDKEKSMDVFVSTPAASAQARVTPVPQPRTSQQVASCGCTGCYCGSTGETITITPTISPAVLLTGGNSERVGGLKVDVEVVNESAEMSLKQMRVIVTQLMRATAQGHTDSTSLRIAETELPCPTTHGEVSAEEYALYSGIVPLSGKNILPTISGQGFSITHTLEIDFPHSKVKKGVFDRAVLIANGEDLYNRVPPMPRHYSGRVQVTEEQL